jgi:DNA helicase-2/ATP-dependent DNA helicase PcrA
VVALRAAASSGAPTDRLVRAIRDEVGLGTAMSLLDQSRGAEGSSHLDDLEALEQVAALHPGPDGFEDWLRAGFGREAHPAGVTLSTVHRVKGMEWDRVVVYGASAGILPHRLADDIEEERRVLHVAVTRGRRQVVVLADRSRPSQFLAELDGSAPHEPVVDRSAAGRGTGAVASVRPTAPARGAAAGRKVRGAPTDEPALSPEAAAVMEQLRVWRRGRSQADKVAAFIVCSDRTLRAIATAAPDSLAALLTVEGIGPTKLDLYGEEILAVVAGATVQP